MNVKMLDLEIENFKGLKKFSINPKGKDADISAANGIGKTTVYDAFLWLLFGKDSTGRKQFDIRPLDGKNTPIDGLTLSVSSALEIDGKIHFLKKQHVEKITKKTVTGYTTECWVNEVPKKVSEYEDYIKSLISEDMFKLLTDLHFFGDKMHWTERRGVLLAIAGKIPKPQGFEELAELLAGRSIDDFKAVLSEQRKRLTKERDEINPRRDEIQRGLDAYAGGDDGAEIQRQELTAALAVVDEKRKKLTASEQLRAALVDKKNALKSQRSERENKLASISISRWSKEKADIEENLEHRRSVLREAMREKQSIEFDVTQLERSVQHEKNNLAEIRAKYKDLKELKPEGKCYACGQDLPADKLALVAELNAKNQVDVVFSGAESKKKLGFLNTGMMSLIEKRNHNKDTIEKASIMVQEAEANKLERFAAIEKLVAANKVNPSADAEWVDLGRQIAETEKEIGAPSSEQLTKLEMERAGIVMKLQYANKALANADNAKKAAIRIKELSDLEKSLGQKIATVDKQLADIDGFKARQSELIEAAVNGKFVHVRFKLFKTLINGNIEDTCDAMMAGVPYAECSYGQKILMGVDIISTLSKHYNIAVPLFIDNAEGLTFDIAAKTQIIRLIAAKNANEITVTLRD